MKRSSFFLLWLGAGILCVPAAAQRGYQIKSTISDAGDTWVYLNKRDGRQLLRLNQDPYGLPNRNTTGTITRAFCGVPLGSRAGIQCGESFITRTAS